MGKGDKKSKRGKIIQGSYGVRRQRKKAGAYIPAPLTDTPAKKPKKTKAATKAELPETPVVPVVEEVVEPVSLPAMTEEAMAPEEAKPAAKTTKKKTTRTTAKSKAATPELDLQDTPAVTEEGMKEEPAAE